MLTNNNRTQKEFARECTEFFAEEVQLFGVPKSVGQIYGLLYASPEPLCFSDIVLRLGISKGSASQGLKLLRSLGAVSLLRPGHSILSTYQKSATNLENIDYYEPELSLRKLVSGILREQVMPLAAKGAARLNRMCELAKLDNTNRCFYLDRANQLNNWRWLLKAVLPLLTALLGPKSKK